MKHEKYWQKRMDDIYRYVDRTDIDVYKELADIYSEFARDLQEEIFKFYGKFATDEGISVDEAKKILRGEDFSDYQENARKYFESAKDNPELLKRLNEQYRASKVTRLEALYLDLEYQLGLLNGTLQVTFEQYLLTVASYSYEKIIGGRSTSTLNKPAMNEIINRPWNGYNYSENIWGNTDNLARDLKKVFIQGFGRGSHPRQMANEIRKRYNVARSRAETLIRTDGTHIVTNATSKRYIDAGLTKYTIHVKLDGRTSDICRKIHEEDKIYEFKDFEPGVTAPPFHPNCRSGILPIESELNQ